MGESIEISAVLSGLPWQQNSNRKGSLYAPFETLRLYYSIEPESHVFRLERGWSLSEWGSDDLGLWPSLDAAKKAAFVDFVSRVDVALRKAEGA